MDTFLPLIKAWKQKGITETHKMLKKKFESSFTFVTFKLFFAKFFCELLHIILYHPIRNIKKMKTDELGINAPIS